MATRIRDPLPNPVIKPVTDPVTDLVTEPATDPAAAWWRYGMVWLVIGGPAVVVVASIGLAVVAYRGADEVLLHTPSARHLSTTPTATTPALAARNHAATAASR